MFCRNCGKELCDEAFVCPECGVLVNEITTKQKKTNNVNENMIDEVKDRKDILFTIFLMVSFGCFCFSLLFCFLSIVVMYISFGAASWFFDYEYAMTSFIASIAALGTGITAFIFGLKKNKEMKLLSILNFMLVITMLFISIALMNNVDSYY